MFRNDQGAPDGSANVMIFDNDDASNLPTYHGEKDRSTARRMIASVGGASGIRTCQRTNADGSVTTLRTRNGFPEITTTRPEVVVADAVRGFVAHVYLAIKAALFSPYTLNIADSKYTLFDAAYTVLPFRTNYNVPEGDDNQWFDVLSVKGGVPRINAKAMPELKVTPGTMRGESVPWLIPESTEDAVTGRYGDEETNTTSKRLFMVGRSAVNYWGSPNLDATLIGAEARENMKAMTNGMKINADAHTVWMSQLSYTGSSWDSSSGGWAFTSTKVAMLLSPPHLLKSDSSTAVDQGLCTLEFRGTSRGKQRSSSTLPATEIACIGHAVVSGQLQGAVTIKWLADTKIPRNLDGFVAYEYADSIYDGSYSATDSVVGLPVKVLSLNAITLSSRSEYKGWNTQMIYFQPNTYTTPQAKLTVDKVTRDGTGNFEWPTDGIAETEIGAVQYRIYGGAIGGLAKYSTSNQSGSFNVTVGDFFLVSGSFSRDKEVGDTLTVLGTDTRLNTVLGQGMAGMAIESDYWANSEATYNDRWGELNAMLLAKANEWCAGCICYGKLLSGTGGGFYKGVIEPRPTVDSRSLNWSTIDFILFDDTNGVYVFVDGSFTGSQEFGSGASATLVVSLKVVTPTGSVAKELFSTTLGFSELLPEQELSGGLVAIPSPKQRVMFTPLHREQGAFRGAAYTTSAEVSAGVTPAYLFNFVLSLKIYASLSYDDGNPVTRPVTDFIPCNLLEMLYAYVFSSKYGVDDVDRYPVDNASVFNTLQATLFNVQRHIGFRDGSFVDWLDSLGGAYEIETTTELYRI